MFKIIKKVFKTFLAVVLLLVLVIIGVSLFVKLKTSGNIVSSVKSLEKADCIVILGAGVKSDGTPSLMLKERLDKGISLYENKISEKILISGDHRSRYYDEVNTMKNYCLNAGVESENIFMDHAGLSTYDSIYRAKEIFGAEKIVIVTQKYHLYRAVYIAQSLGLEVTGVACDTATYKGQAFRNLREVFAQNKDVLMCIFKPEAEVMGEKISLNSNGNITNE